MIVMERAKSQVNYAPSETSTASTCASNMSQNPTSVLANFKPIPSQVSAIFVDLLQALGVHLQQAPDSSDVAFFRSLQDVSASKRPKLWMAVQGPKLGMSGSPRLIS